MKFRSAITLTSITLLLLIFPSVLGFNITSYKLLAGSSQLHDYGEHQMWNGFVNAPLSRNIFYGKLHAELCKLILQAASSSETLTVLATYNKNLSRDDIVARIQSKVEVAQIIFTSNHVPTIILRLPAEEIHLLEEVNGINYIFADQEVKLYHDKLALIDFYKLQRETVNQPSLYLNESSKIMGADRLWRLGVDGRGVYLAVIDSGVNWTHPDLVGKVVFSASFVPYEDPMDYFGHGTHVAGIAAGTGAASQGRFRGMAPGAYIINVKVFDRNGTANLLWILQAFEALLTMNLPIHVVLMCWGTYPLPESHPLNLYMAEFAKRNITLVAAAGNQAYYWTVGSPANSPYVISVGASTKDDRLAFFTSKGPDPYTMRTLPLITAPGVNVIAPISGALTQYSLSENPYYAKLSGTSMAAAHVAGAIALLLSAFPYASPNAIKAALLLSVEDIGYDVNAMGAGRINVYKAYEILSRRVAFAAFHPKAITGFEAPFIACFPGDVDFFNITILTSTSISNARLAVTGNVSQIFFIKHLELGSVSGPAFIWANITIPEEAQVGLYLGSLELWSASTPIVSMPIEVKVVKPIATILWDDMHDFTLGYQFLWRWYITYWQAVSAAGIRIIPASMAGFGLATSQLATKFNAILLMDPYWSFTDKDIQTLISYVRGGGNLLIVYGQRADMTRINKVLEEFGITVINLRATYGYPIYSNTATMIRPEHPAIAGVSNLTILMGWVSLEPSGKAVPLVRVRDKAYYEMLSTQGYPLPLEFTVMAAYEHAPYMGRLLVIGNDYMFDDVWINTWWHVDFPQLIIDYAKASGNKMLAQTATLWITGDTIPPKVSIVSPATGGYVKGVSTIKALAEDGQSGVGEVIFYVNGKPMFRDDKEPYEFEWNTTELCDGAYTIEVAAYDRAGNKNSTEITLVIDNTKPMISITSPKDQTFVKGFLTVNFSVFDANPLSVYYSIDDGPQISITNKTSFVINTFLLADGMHKITITALDRAGNIAAESITIMVDNTPPTASINSPIDGSHLKGISLINVTGVDANLKAMDLLISGELTQTWSEAGTRAYSWNTHAYADGQYKITLKAYDWAGNIASTSIWVTIDNTPPVAAVIEPHEGAYLSGTCKITIYGWDANIHLIELYVNNNLLETWPIAGLHTFIWNTKTLTDGNYEIRLICRDIAGNTVEKEIKVIVDNTPPTVSISAPEDGAQLTGITQIEFNASDENLGKILLYIDDASFDVTGKTRHIWDTTTVGDGPHVIKIVAIDKAGNIATAQITVITINVQKAALESYEAGRKEGYEEGYRTGKSEGYAFGERTGIILGGFLGSTISVLIAYILSKRRRLTSSSQLSKATRAPVEK